MPYRVLHEAPSAQHDAHRQPRSRPCLHHSCRALLLHPHAHDVASVQALQPDGGVLAFPVVPEHVLDQQRVVRHVPDVGPHEMAPEHALHDNRSRERQLCCQLDVAHLVPASRGDNDSAAQQT